MPTDDSFADLMGRLRQGDDTAAASVFHRFAHRLIALARIRLDSRLRPKVDPEDVLQSVFKSFFLRHAAGQFDLGGWDGLWALLTVITVRKCGRVNRYFRSAGRDAETAATVASSDSSPAWEALASDPSPSEVLMLTELVEGLLRDLPERDRAVVVLGLQGYNAAEISTQLGRPERSVYRVLQRVRSRLERMKTDDATLAGPTES
jgi:RNA polymerase sigma-70 factor (ECF subfamily)